jgi:hypothetical protein
MNWLNAFRPKLFEQLDGRVDLDHLEIPDFKPGPAEVVERRELANAVLGAVDSLPPKYRVPLTMFHLDGLSYKKVADFLDIPLGTVKTLIRRARGKLRSALAAYAAEEISPMVQEVFNEHKLGEEFARKVLENIADLDWVNGECCFCGSVAACMEFMKEPFTYDFVAGVSGSAFKLLWHPEWRASNDMPPLLGEEPVRRAFRALGFEYRYLPKTDEANGEDEFRRQIIGSIEKGRPVIAHGVAAPPRMAGVVTGYDLNGNVLLGRSYFHDGSDGYYRKADWYDGCWGLIVIGDKVEAPSKRQILQEAIEWAVELARTPQRDARMSGLAAYDAWAEALKRDEDFPEGNLRVLTGRCHISNAIVLPGLLDARKAAAKFLRSMAEIENAPTADVLAAAAAYDDEAGVLFEASKLAPICTAPEQKRLEMADPRFRAKLAELIIAAKGHDTQAIGHLSRGLRLLEAETR